MQICNLQFLIWSNREFEGFAVIIFEAVGVRFGTFGSSGVVFKQFELEVINMAPSHIPDFSWNTVEEPWSVNLEAVLAQILKGLFGIFILVGNIT